MQRAKSHLWPLKYIDSKQLVYCYDKESAFKVITEFGISTESLLSSLVDKKLILQHMQSYSEIECNLFKILETTLDFNSKIAFTLKNAITPQIAAQCSVLNCSNLILLNSIKIIKRLTIKNVQQYQIKMMSNVYSLAGGIIANTPQINDEY
jgi:hypothetical protein